MDEAIKKLQAEISGSKNNAYVKLIGEFLISHISANPGDSDKILTADKTIAKSLVAMKSEAQKKAVNGMAMLTDEEGFAIVLKYFGISTRKSNPQPDHTVSKFDVSLDELLG